MDDLQQFLKIPRISSDTNFWMIRAKKGFFFDEFLEKGYIAIGWNLIEKSMISNDLSHSEKNILKSSVKEYYGESKPGEALNKCLRFCFDIKIGDIAVIVDNPRIAFVYIGEYYEEDSRFNVDLEMEVHNKIERSNSRQNFFQCPYKKRRKISVIRVLDHINMVSPYLQNAISKNLHSLSKFNDHAELVISGCFDTVIYDDKLMLTFRVNKKEDINVLDLSNFVLNAANLLSNNKPETISVKTNLHSPGDILLQVWDFLKDNSLPLLICYIAIFGGKAHNYEFNSLIGIIKDIINSKYDKKKNDLELRKMKLEVEKMEFEFKMQKKKELQSELDDNEKMRLQQLKNIDSCVEPLANASDNLDIQLSESTIIDISDFLKEHQDKE